MFKRLRLLVLLSALSVTLGFMSSTYSRYIADANGNIKIGFAKWQIKVNNNDITDSSVSSINIVPVIKENINIAENTVAPSSSGYFDIVIDPTNVDVSFNYSISIELLNENMPDLVISKYAILNETYKEGDDITYEPLTDGIIKDSFTHSETKNYNTFTIRVCFDWYEGNDELMDDNADTQIGIDAANNNSELQIKATIHFEQQLWLKVYKL